MSKKRHGRIRLGQYRADAADFCRRAAQSLKRAAAEAGLHPQDAASTAKHAENRCRARHDWRVE